MSLTKEEFISAFLADPDRAHASYNDSRRENTATSLWHSFQGVLKHCGKDWYYDIPKTLDTLEEEYDNLETRKKKVWSLLLMLRYSFLSNEASFQATNATELPLDEILFDVEERHAAICTKLYGKKDNTNDKNEVWLISKKEQEHFFEHRPILLEQARLYLNQTSNFLEDYEDITARIEILQHRLLVLLYIMRVPFRLEIMKILSERPQTRRRRAELDEQKQNYIFLTEKHGYLKLNDYKTVSSYGPVRIQLTTEEIRCYRDLYDQMSTMRGYNYLFLPSVGCKQPNFSKRLQECFLQVFKIPFSVDILRKMYVLDYVSKPRSGREMKWLSKELKNNANTINDYYSLTLPPRDEDNRLPVIELNRPPTIRLGPMKKDYAELAALTQTRGLVWDVPHKHNDWTKICASNHIVMISDIPKPLSEVLSGKDKRLVMKKALSLRKKVELNTIAQ